MSPSQWFEIIWLILVICFGAGLMWYLFLGPGSSRWYK